MNKNGNDEEEIEKSTCKLVSSTCLCTQHLGSGNRIVSHKYKASLNYITKLIVDWVT